MKNLTLHIISNNILDSFMYMGRIFIITKDERLGYVKNTYLFKKYIKNEKLDKNKHLYRIFFNNSRLESGSRYTYNQEYQKEFDKIWRRYANKKIEIELSNDEIEFLTDAPKYPILDIKIYGQKIIIANRQGIFDCQLSIDQKNVDVVHKFERIFDSKSLSINPRLGEILVSTNSDGLFRGTMWNRKKIKIYKKPISKESSSNSWTKYNFINYEDELNSRLYHNELEDIEGNLPNFLREDRFGKPYKIKRFGFDNLDLDELLMSKISRKDILFTFNSLSYLFIVSKRRELFYLKVDDSENKEYSQTSVGNFYRKLKLKVPKATGKPIAGMTISNGVLIEFYNKIYQFREGHVDKVFTGKAIEVRGYPNSIRYKNLIQLNLEDGVQFQSLYPYIKRKTTDNK